MSASDGLLKLTEYLNQTRRQAEAAIDVLNNRIEEMKEENETCMNMIEKLERFSKRIVIIFFFSKNRICVPPYRHPICFII